MADLLNKTGAKYVWTPSMVKSARCTVDPDWLLIRSPSSPANRTNIKKLIVKFLIVAESYTYEGEDSKALDPTWEYLHPRTNCDHSQSDGDRGRNAKDIVVPEDAVELVGYIENGRLSISWQRDSAGPAHQAEYDTADTY